jgi:hypothetical protein
MLQKREQVPKCGSNEEEKKNHICLDRMRKFTTLLTIQMHAEFYRAIFQMQLNMPCTYLSHSYVFLLYHKPY